MEKQEERERWGERREKVLKNSMYALLFICCFLILPQVSPSSPSTTSGLSAAPCGHVFHTVCVSQWTLERRHCPQCRRPVGRDQAAGDLVRLFLSGEDVQGGGGGQKLGPEHHGKEQEEQEEEGEEARSRVDGIKERLLHSEREKEESKIIQVGREGRVSWLCWSMRHC